MTAAMICRKTMQPCMTPGMCVPFEGCGGDAQRFGDSPRIAALKAELARVKAERDAAVVDAERYLHCFAHRHQTWLTGGDDCKKCGLDLRDPIHSQAAIDAARKEGK